MRLYQREKNERLLTPVLIAPIVLMAVIALALLVMARGREMKLAERRISFLEPACEDQSFHGELEKDEKAPYLLVYDGAEEGSVKLRDIAAGILDDMRLTYRCVDPAQEEIVYEDVSLLLLCTESLEGFGGQFETFAHWISENDFIWLCMPQYSELFVMLYRTLGISYCTGEFAESVNGLVFQDDFVAGLEGKSFPNIQMGDVALEVNLESSAKLHISSGDGKLPLVWSYERSNGSMAVVFNTNLLYERNNVTGLITAALAEVEDTLLWPVINAVSVFIDDFPAPQPEGYDERLKEQFGYSTKSFYMNVWWPDMKETAEKYGIRYTGVLIEDYNENTEPPFEAGTADSILQYYGAELLSEGGEIALHGYNHQPLIPEGTPTEDDYAGWPSTENMTLAVKELVRYAGQIFPDVSYAAYVPPSNDLSAEGKNVLKNTVPGLRVISGIYYDNEDGTSYMTDFEETEDGLINYPRISAGFSPEEVETVRIYCMLYSKGVFSHFIHPDDVLDAERGADLGWEAMHQAYDKLLEDVTESYPGIRMLTASSGGGAVQRYERARYQTEQTEQAMQIHLEPFTDEVWLALSTKKEPAEVNGAQITKLGDGFYWLCCNEREVEIRWQEDTP